VRAMPDVYAPAGLICTTNVSFSPTALRATTS